MQGAVGIRGEVERLTAPAAARRIAPATRRTARVPAQAVRRGARRATSRSEPALKEGARSPRYAGVSSMEPSGAHAGNASSSNGFEPQTTSGRCGRRDGHKQLPGHIRAVHLIQQQIARLGLPRHGLLDRRHCARSSSERRAVHRRLPRRPGYDDARDDVRRGVLGVAGECPGPRRGRDRATRAGPWLRKRRVGRELTDDVLGYARNVVLVVVL
jgi:hypothetical protein